MYNKFDLTGKVAVVVGGHGGIGKAIALGLADGGADVVVASRSLEPLKVAAQEIQAKGRKSLAISVDIVDIKSVNEMVNTILRTFPRIDILVNAAGLAIRKPAETFPIEEFNQVMDVNVTGTFTVCQAVGNIMIKQKYGSIVNLSSVRGDHGLRANYAAYCASKGAVNTLTKTLACEFAKYNVRVNAIAPTMVETDLTKDALKDPVFAKNMMASIPMGRWLMPEELVGSAIFFASDASNFVTGQILYVDGGVDAD
jgi:NAD(P)-dependent dehydrogenase (short-subunit alcohol dehydrogenase family)